MIVAPKKVYPNMIVQVQVSIFKLYHKAITVRASIRKDGEEHAAFTETFDSPTTKMAQMRVSMNTCSGHPQMINSFLSTGWAKKGPVRRLGLFFSFLIRFSLTRMY